MIFLKKIPLCRLLNQYLLPGLLMIGLASIMGMFLYKQKNRIVSDPLISIYHVPSNQFSGFFRGEIIVRYPHDTEAFTQGLFFCGWKYF